MARGDYSVICKNCLPITLAAASWKMSLGRCAGWAEDRVFLAVLNSPELMQTLGVA